MKSRNEIKEQLNELQPSEIKTAMLLQPALKYTGYSGIRKAIETLKGIDNATGIASALRQLEAEQHGELLNEYELDLLCEEPGDEWECPGYLIEIGGTPHVHCFKGQLRVTYGLEDCPLDEIASMTFTEGYDGWHVRARNDEEQEWCPEDYEWQDRD